MFLGILIYAAGAVAVMIRQPSEGEDEVTGSRVTMAKVWKYLLMDLLIILAIFVGCYHRFLGTLLIRFFCFMIFYYCKELVRLGYLETYKVIIDTIGVLGFLFAWVSQPNQIIIPSPLQNFSFIQLPYIHFLHYYDRRQEARRAAALEDEPEEESAQISIPYDPEDDQHQHPVRSQALQHYLECLEDERLNRQEISELLITAHIFGYFERLEQEQLRNQPAGEVSDLYRFYIDLGDHFTRQQNEEDDRELTDEDEELEYARIRVYGYLQEYYAFMEANRQQEQMQPEGGLMNGVNLLLQELFQLEEDDDEAGINGEDHVLQQFVEQQ